MTKEQKKIVFYTFLVIFVIVIVTIIWRKKSPQSVTLEIWGFLDQPEVFNSLISDFRHSYPYITINYALKEQQNYQEELLKAFADNQAPDIFMVLGNWVPKYQDKGYEDKYYIFLFFGHIFGKLRQKLFFWKFEEKPVMSYS